MAATWHLARLVNARNVGHVDNLKVLNPQPKVRCATVVSSGILASLIVHIEHETVGSVANCMSGYLPDIGARDRGQLKSDLGRKSPCTREGAVATSKTSSSSSSVSEGRTK